MYRYVYFLAAFISLHAATEISTNISDVLPITMAGTYSEGSWQARLINEDDKEYFTKLFTNKQTMIMFANGNIKDEEYIQAFMDKHLKRVADGTPNAGMVVYDMLSKLRLAYVVSGGSGTDPYKGRSEIAYIAFNEDCASEDTPSIWGKGLTTSVINSLTTRWAPKIAELGLSNELFHFATEPLALQEATSSPFNIGSWMVLLKNGFEADFSTQVAKQELPFEYDFQQFSLKPDEKSNWIEELKKRIFHGDECKIKSGFCYNLKGPEGKIFSLFIKPDYSAGGLRFAFKKNVS